MSLSKRIDSAIQTYHNYLNAHPNTIIKTLKAFSKAAKSFCNRKVMEWSSANKKLPYPNSEKDPSDSQRTLSERDPSISEISQSEMPEGTNVFPDLPLAEKPTFKDDKAKSTLAKSRGARLPTKYRSIEDTNKENIKKHLEEYIKNHQSGLFRESDNSPQFKEAQSNITSKRLTNEQLNNPNLLASLFKSLVKSDPPFSRQLTNEMIKAAELFKNDQKEQAEQLVEETRKKAQSQAAQKTWFNDTLELMQLAYQEAPDTGIEKRTQKNMLCNLFVDSLLQLPESKSPDQSTAELKILSEQTRSQVLAAIALSILFSKKD